MNENINGKRAINIMVFDIVTKNPISFYDELEIIKSFIYFLIELIGNPSQSAMKKKSHVQSLQQLSIAHSFISVMSL